MFLLPGMGADERLFMKIDLSGYEVVNIRWMAPVAEDTLGDYACRLINKYGIADGDSLIGVSLGGMIGVEIAKQVNLKHAIIVSSIKSPVEAPFYYTFFRMVPLYKLFSGRILVRLGFLFRSMMGKMPGAHARLFYSMLKGTSPKFLKWSIKACVGWDNDVVPQGVVHLIGDADRVFSYKKILSVALGNDRVKVIAGGDHMMVLNKADEIERIVKEVLGS